MRKFLFLVLFLGFAVSFVADADAAPRRREAIQITTYYPAPYGAYHRMETDFLKVNPQDNTVEDTTVAGSITCNNANLGQMYFFNGTDVIGSTSVDASLRLCTRVFDTATSSYNHQWVDVGMGSGGQDFVMDPVSPTPLPFTGYLAYPRRLKFNPDIPDYASTVTDNVFFDKDLSGEEIAVRTRDRIRFMLNPATGLREWMCADGSPIDNSQGARRCYPAALTVDGFANVAVTGGRAPAARVGVGTDNPQTVLDIVSAQDNAVTNPSDPDGNLMPLIRVNGNAMMQIYRIRHDPANGVNLRPAAGQDAAHLSLNISTEDFYCTVGGKSSRYIRRAYAAGDYEHETAWVYEGANSWMLRYADPYDRATTAHYNPRVEVVCYPRELVAVHLMPSVPATNNHTSHEL